ncbi:gastrin/cholecystokinin type B receptor-like protein [Leptotrombidium deliense]|uniref:Gastrin/cholecystokinin type B receptor-like protein n=1 Tax=Leptotrombidium deliense TaxID=299467 RepID=A0A443SP97_9ACAR|nr:gastrin/cholecystokinin type B receptor-like protein [Leptotrombidium deliense]
MGTSDTSTWKQLNSVEKATAITTVISTRSANTTADEYDYDLWEALETYNYADLIPTAIVYGITLITGIIGNGLIVYSVSHFRRMRTLSNVFLASLALADLLLIIFCVPVKFGQLFSYTWEFGEFCCKFVHYMQNVSAICSVLTLTTMSIERYYAIIHPVKSRYMCTMSQTRKIIAFIWITSLVAATPVLFVQVHMEVGSRHKGYWCVRAWNQKTLWRLYECYMLLLILIIPSVVMAYTYKCICLQLRGVIVQRASMFCGNDNFTGNIELKEANGISERDTAITVNGDANNSSKRALHQLCTAKADEDSNTVKQVSNLFA